MARGRPYNRTTAINAIKRSMNPRGGYPTFYEEHSFRSAKGANGVRQDLQIVLKYEDSCYVVEDSCYVVEVHECGYFYKLAQHNNVDISNVNAAHIVNKYLYKHGLYMEYPVVCRSASMKTIHDDISRLEAFISDCFNILQECVNDMLKTPQSLMVELPVIRGYR